MWGQSWTNLASLVKPYPDAEKIDIDDVFATNYTILKMYETANDFFKSLGLEDCAISFNTTRGAMITKPNNTEVLCHASSYDMVDGKDFR